MYKINGQIVSVLGCALWERRPSSGSNNDQFAPNGGGGGGVQDPWAPNANGEITESCQEEIDPCDTNGEHPALDDIDVQETMYDVWSDSYGSDIDGLPDDQRNEAMFMVLATTSGYVTGRIPAGPGTSSCQFKVGSYSVPSNVVALIHTHPYSDGDSINDPRCPSGKIYDADDVSPGDQTVMNNFISVGYDVPFYVMDKDEIHVLEPSDSTEYADEINRCGY